MVAPNDTIIAAYEVDTQTTDHIKFTLSSTEADKGGKDQQLVFYRKRCDYLDPSSVEVHIDEEVNVSADAARMEIHRLYLVPHSTLDYVVNLTLHSDRATAKEVHVPRDCYATIYLFNDYFALSSFLRSNDTTDALSSYSFCNTSTLHFTLIVSKSSYYFLGLYKADRGQIESAGVHISGTLFYLDNMLYEDEWVCHITPSVNSSCNVATGHLTDFAKLCIVITRGTPYVPGTDPSSVAMVAIGNNVIAIDDSYYGTDDIIRLERRLTTYWGINRTAVFVCLFTPLMIGCCVLTMLSPRRTNYGSYVRATRKRLVNA